MEDFFLNFTFAIRQIGDTMQLTNVIGSSSMVGRILFIHHCPPTHTWSIHPKRLTIMPSAIIFCPFGIGLTSPIMRHTSTVPLNLPPSEVEKPETVFVKPIRTSFRSILPCSKPPTSDVSQFSVRYEYVLLARLAKARR